MTHQPNEDLKTKLVQTLGLHGSSPEVQSQIIVEIAQAADEKIMLALDELMTEEQLNQVQTMKDAGESPDAIIEWVEKSIPDYPTLLSLTMQDLADEIVQKQMAVEKLANNYGA